MLVKAVIVPVLFPSKVDSVPTIVAVGDALIVDIRGHFARAILFPAVVPTPLNGNCL